MANIKLNLGCGHDYLDDFINVDIDSSVKSDLNCDIKDLKFMDVPIIRVWDTLEHLDLNTIRHIQRMCKVGGVLDIRVPYYANYTSVHDITHVNFFNSRTFKCRFFKKFKIMHQRLEYNFFNNRIRFSLPYLVDLFREKFLPGVLPPSTIYVKLKKV